MPLKVLIVDDDQDMRSLISDALSANGIESIQAGNAMDAVKQFLKGGIGMITLDINMPGMSGLELHKSLSQEFGAGRRTHGKSLKKLPYILIVTGHVTDELKLRSQYGESIVGILTKPFEVQLLVDIVKDTLDRAEKDLKKSKSQ